MKIGGHNLFAIIAAAIAMYFVEFVIYGLCVPEALYTRLAHIAEADAAASQAKMAFGIMGPLVWALGLSVAVSWRGVKGAGAGASTGALAALLFMLPARFYQFVYGPTGIDFFALDAFHFLFVGAIGGAIIGAWPEGKR